MRRLTPSLPNGEKTVMTHFRGYFTGPYRGAGSGLRIPSDLVAIDEATDPYDDEFAIWYSPATRRYWALCYDSFPCRQEWYGFRLRSKSAAAARAELQSALSSAMPE